MGCQGSLADSKPAFPSLRSEFAQSETLEDEDHLHKVPAKEVEDVFVRGVQVVNILLKEAYYSEIDSTVDIS